MRVLWFYLLAIVALTHADDESVSDDGIILSLTQLEPPKSAVRYTQQTTVVFDEGPKSKKHQKQIQLTLVNEFIYVALMTVGTPPQKLRVQVDITSGTLWVRSSVLCISNKTYCETRRTYNHCKSKTYTDYGRDFTYYYGNGGNEIISGRLVQDNFGIGDITVKNQVLLEATVFDNVTIDLDIDGALGLYRENEVTLLKDEPLIYPPIVNMIKQKVLQRSKFAIYISKLGSGRPSELSLGSSNMKRYTGTFQYTNLIDIQYYWILVDRIELDFITFPQSFYTMITPHVKGIIGPKDYMNSFNGNISATFNKDDGNYYVDCDKVDELPIVTIVINKYNYTLSGREYVIQPSSMGDNKCLSGFFADEELNAIYLGTTFMQKHYIEFDLDHNTVGLAIAK